MTENTIPEVVESAEPSRVDALEAELARLRAERAAVEKVAPELSMRERSPIKPQDHKPADHEKVAFEFRGETYEVDARFSRDVRTAAMFNKNDFETAISKMIGADGYEALLTSLEDEDGFVDAELLGGWVNAFFDKAGAKN